MADDWKILGREVPAGLLRIATSEQALASLDEALAELDVRVVMARELCLGPMARALAVRSRGPRADGITPANLLQEALAEVRRLSATHGEVARAFDLYRANVADAGEQHALGDVIDARRSETMRAAKEALDHLLAAATNSEAAADSYAVAQGVPYESPLWGGCTSAAENLARLALQDATTAHGAVTRMLDGLALEFFDTWMLLKAAEKQPWKRLARSVPRPLELAARLDGVVQDLRSLHSQLRKLSDQLRVKTSNMPAAGASGSSAASVIADLEAAHLPPWLTKITDKICQWTGLFPSAINHVLINEYHPNQGIMPHQDGPAYFPVVAIISLASPVVIDFTPHGKLRGHEYTYLQSVQSDELQESNGSHKVEDTKEADPASLSLLLMPSSLLIFKDQAYTDFLHGIQDNELHILDKVANISQCPQFKNQNSDKRKGKADADSELTGTFQRTTTRVSLTCRLVLKVHNKLFKF